MDDKRWQKVFALVGLGIRGRLAVVGVERVREAAMKGTLHLALVASDASRHSREKVLPLLAAKGVQVVDGASAATLGAAAGRETTAVIGIVDAQLAKGIRGIVDSVVRASARERMV
ncbi:MAG: L7Ae/L30e/S12e/Gadd45 family ribosomal protein [Gemmatimonadales bacterium]